MKIALIPIILVIAVLACGCTATAPASQALPAATAPEAPAVTPDLKGTWTGTSLSYEEGVGFTDFNKTPLSLVITEQQGRLFSGHLQFGSVHEKTIPVAGVISRDGRTFAMVEDVNGFTTGELTGTGTMELTHVDDAQPYSVALDMLERA